MSSTVDLGQSVGSGPRALAVDAWRGSRGLRPSLRLGLRSGFGLLVAGDVVLYLAAAVTVLAWNLAD
jgi:hypothetical protein